MSTITAKERRELKAKAHSLKPVILVGAKGITESLIAETDNALNTHELIKVKLAGEDRKLRAEMADTLCESLQAELIQLIGRTAIVYRENPEKA